ncbi:3-keto-5-aminohexanoate cleavage protein [Micromonospora sp. WMMD1128]|uniref:3-keto-5-aminohexanoate cleavage protein n=1 Tax=Micromonospora sp. WMMD1128 TaxID=3015150 RepID=UPI00248BB4EF|nr:3-keto-5-aminohexanoate cleavage protein [Micromonospora sp. WMMD1128]WBB72174.1 3-keto-5-aminohexanoate cleavage protein [Micromonospora sp. WMMD1128]
MPLTPAELAADAVRCAEAGVAAVHVHPRDDGGVESLDPAVVAAALTAVRAVRPGLPVGVSTGAWIVPDPAARVAAVRAWTVLPDFASVNAHEPGAAEVAAALHERGVMVEAGLWTEAAVDAWRRWPTPTGRLLVECMAEPVEAALADATAILAALADATGILARRADTPAIDAGPPDGCPPVLLHGEGPATWPVFAEAVRRGLHTRIGLEDTLLLPDGSIAADNRTLVQAAQAQLTP